jgi:hypothetical protein
VFPKPGHELVEGHEASHESLNVFDVLDWTHPGEGWDIIGVWFNAMFGNDVPQELPPGDSEGAFLRVQLVVESLEVLEGFFQVRDGATSLSWLYHDVVYINLEVTPYFLFEAKLHTPLICSPCIFQSEQHFYVAKTTKMSDERGGWLVRLGEGYLVIARVGIQKAQELTSGCEIYDLVDAEKRK